MSQLSRELNTFCKKNPTANTCKNIDSAMPYFSIIMLLGGILGTIWVLFLVKEKDSNNIEKPDLIQRIAFSSLPLFFVGLGYQGIVDPDGSTDSIFYVFLLTVPAIIIHRKTVLKWISETYSE